MRAKDVMSPNVMTIERDASVLQAVRLMLQRRISGLPVVDRAGELVGIVTEGDFLRRAELGTERRRSRWIELLLGPGMLADDYVHASGRKVHEVMTSEVHGVTEEAPLRQVVDLMERNHVKRVPVLRGRKPVGMITRANLLRALAGISREPTPALSDSAIREMLLDQLKSQPWAPATGIGIAVSDGVVKLTGTILDDRQRDALRVVAENIPGVKSVEDELAWVEPMSGMVVEAARK